MHWLIAQSFHDAFVPACVYQAAPWLVFRFARSTGEVMSRGHRPTPHNSHPAGLTSQSNLQ
jgi:hypothetical protein